MKAKGLSISHLSKIYPSRNGKEKEVRAVDDISLDINPGEFITLLGPSGCGKTTTLRMVAGFETPTGGEIFLDGQPINHLPPNKRDTAMVFQTYALFPNLNVYDNIAYGLKIKKLPEAEIKRKIQGILEMVGLTGLETRHTNELSGGQQQRVALARALVMEPSVLLFDEPLSNLDAKLRIQMRTEIRKIQKAVGITAIYVTHDQAEAMSMSDRIVIINNGKIEQVGSPEDVYYHPASEFTANFIGTANIVPAKVEGIDSNGNLNVSLYGVSLKGIASGRTYRVGDDCLLVIRPEACSVQDSGGFFDISVTLSTFMGSYQLYEAEFGGNTFVIHENNPKNKDIKEAGEKARLVVDISDIHAI